MRGAETLRQSLNVAIAWSGIKYSIVVPISSRVQLRDVWLLGDWVEEEEPRLPRVARETEAPVT